ncbi:MAG: hypothetical protein IT537_08440 [Hyphomicrobiales bacterium]|nr:hypothetical protein [Hyphomicrobiales bacterium]
MDQGSTERPSELGPHLRGRNLAEIAVLLLGVPESTIPTSPAETSPPDLGPISAGTGSPEHGTHHLPATAVLERVAALMPPTRVESPPMAPGIGGPNIDPPPARPGSRGQPRSIESSVAATERIAQALRDTEPMLGFERPAPPPDARPPLGSRALALSIVVLLLVAVSAMVAVFEPSLLKAIHW